MIGDRRRPRAEAAGGVCGSTPRLLSKETTPKYDPEKHLDVMLPRGVLMVFPPWVLALRVLAWEHQQGP